MSVTQESKPIPLLDSTGKQIGHVESIRNGEHGETIADLVYDNISQTPVDQVLRSFFQVPANSKSSDE